MLPRRSRIAILRIIAIRPWPRRLQDVDDANVDEDLPTMMYGMGLVGVIFVVLAVLGVIALLKYLT
jgi:hypothetical protein